MTSSMICMNHESERENIVLVPPQKINKGPFGGEKSSVALSHGGRPKTVWWIGGTNRTYLKWGCLIIHIFLFMGNIPQHGCFRIFIVSLFAYSHPISFLDSDSKKEIHTTILQTSPSGYFVGPNGWYQIWLEILSNYRFEQNILKQSMAMIANTGKMPIGHFQNIYFPSNIFWIPKSKQNMASRYQRVQESLF